MAKRWVWLVLVVACAAPAAAPAAAQGGGEIEGLRSTYALQRPWAEGVRAHRAEVTDRVMEIARAVMETEAGPRRTALLADAQVVVEQLVAVDDELAAAETALAETRVRLENALEARIERLRAAADTAAAVRDSLLARARALEAERSALERGAPGGVDSGAGAALAGVESAVASLARIAAEERDRLATLDRLRDELRVFVGGLRLFDETGMPPSARSGTDDEPGAGCPVSSCPVSGFSPTDGLVPDHETGRAPGDRGAVVGEVTVASLADLLGDLDRYVDGVVAEVPQPAWSREVTVGMAAMGFRALEGDREGVGPTAGASWVLGYALGSALELTVEPSLGIRTLRVGDTFLEGAAEVRETLSHVGGGGRWEVGAWQRLRLVPEASVPQGYLEPGRGEGGVVGRFVIPVGARWQADLMTTGDAVRYAPETWQILNRQGVGGGAGVARLGTTGSARLAVQAAHYRFPERASPLAPHRADTRVSVSIDGALEGETVIRFSAAGTWNRSRIAAYDYAAARAAVVTSVPWGGRSFQLYAGMARQSYPDPGAGEVVVRDDDTGSVVALQYSHPMDGGRVLAARVGWMRSRTGLGDDFYQRLWASLRLGFRGG